MSRETKAAAEIAIEGLLGVATRRTASCADIVALEAVISDQEELERLKAIRVHVRDIATYCGVCQLTLQRRIDEIERGPERA